jgi:hypothetical protein
MGEVERDAIEAPRWSPAKRIAFRFAFAYFLLSILTPFGLVGLLLNAAVPFHDTVGVWWKRAVEWVGRTVFGVTITALPAGSGDTSFNYVEVFCWAVLAAAITLIWTVVDRRPSHPRLFGLLRTVLRHFLALIMIFYGAAKVVPVQFGPLSPGTLITPLGDRSPMGLLWTFMAASPYYTAFTGAIELAGALLLTSRRTTLLGALVCAAALTQVVLLNYCYDVPVKLFSSHLLAMSLFLIAPDAGRLWDFFVRGRAVAPTPTGPRFRRRWLARTVLGVKAAAYLVVTLGAIGFGAYAVHKYRFLGPPAPLHGVWDVEEFERDGKTVPPLATDATRWKQFVIERYGEFAGGTIVPMTGEPDERKLELDEAAKRMTLKEDEEKGRPALALAYEEPEPGVLVVSGTVDGKPVRAKLRHVPPERYVLVSRGFHWVNEKPFNK